MTDQHDDTQSQSSLFSLSDLVKNYQPKDKNKYISREFQDYGYALAMELGDEPHKSLYIKMAKEVDRGILEAARSFVSDAQARSKAKLFMWKVKELRRQSKKKYIKGVTDMKPTLLLQILFAAIFFGLFLVPFGMSIFYLLFLLGGVVGLSFFWWETVFHIFSSTQFTDQRSQSKQLLRQGKIFTVVRLLQRYSQSMATVSRSYLFIGVYIVVAVFVITSTGSAIGVGAIFGLGLRYLLDIWIHWQDFDGLNQLYGRLFDFRLKKSVLSIFRWVYVLLFSLLALLVIV